MKPGKVRPIAICPFRRAGKILAAENYDATKAQTFYRPLGGRIEFGERGAETVRREIEEELGLEACNLRYLGTLENIFIYNGEKGHEIVLVYDGEFRDPAAYAHPVLVGKEDSGEPLRAVWLTLADYAPGQAPAPLYPTGLWELLEENP